MSIVTLPTTFKPVDLSFGQNRYDTMERSDSTGSEAARLLAPPRWTCSLTSHEHMTLIDAGTWEAWLLKLRGGVNVAAIYDPVRQLPEGTMRGTVTLGVAAAAGATSITIGNAIGTNLLHYPSAYNNAAWTRDRVTITTNATTDPDGTTTADKIVEDTTASASHLLRQAGIAVVSGQTYTFSISLLAGERTQATLYLNDGSSTANRVQTIVDLSAGTLSSTLANGTFSGASATIASHGGGWYRIALTGTVAVSSVNVRVYLQTVGGYSGDGTSGLYAWGAMLESGSTASTYPQRPTLKAGDWLQIGTGVGTSQLVKVVEDATAADYTEVIWTTNGGAQVIWTSSGGQATWSSDGAADAAVTVTIEPPLRTAFAKGTTVTYERPVGYYRAQGSMKSRYSTQAWHRQGGFAADFVETFNT